MGSKSLWNHKVDANAALEKGHFVLSAGATPKKTRPAMRQGARESLDMSWAVDYLVGTTGTSPGMESEAAGISWKLGILRRAGGLIGFGQVQEALNRAKAARMVREAKRVMVTGVRGGKLDYLVGST